MGPAAQAFNASDGLRDALRRHIDLTTGIRGEVVALSRSRGGHRLVTLAGQPVVGEARWGGDAEPVPGMAVVARYVPDERGALWWAYPAAWGA